MTYTVTMNVAGAGTPTSDGGSSAFGHMWYSLDNGSGIPVDYGYAPKEDSNPLNDAWGPGEVFINDSTHYIADQAHPITTVTIELTPDQYNDMIAFGEAAKTSSDWETYNGAWNSCVDFVWAALKAAGLNPTGFQGDVFPTSNIDDLQRLLIASIQLKTELIDGTLIAIQAAAGVPAVQPLTTPTTYTIYGDLNPTLWTVYDDWDNIISGGQAAPGRSDHITGSPYSDLIYAGGGNDMVWGHDGNDMILGGTGDDTLFGDDGIGGTGDDYIDGGDGNDSIWANGGNDTIFGGAGDDSIAGDEGNGGTGEDYIDGGDGNDTIWGNSGNDTIFGGMGDDTLNGDNGIGGTGEDYIDGGDGNDSIWGNGGNDTIFGGAGDDSISGDDGGAGGEQGNDYIDGGEGNDKLWGSGGNDTIFGGAGADYLVGDNGDGSTTGDDYLDGGDGDDHLGGEGGDDILIGGAGNDTLEGYTGANYLDGGAGNDHLNSGGPGSNLFGGAGDDILEAAGGDNYLDGETGNNTLLADGGGNILFAGTGNDTLEAAGGNNYLDGGDGTNLLVAAGGGNMLIAGAGDDTLSAWEGGNYLDGGDGNNTLFATGDGNTLFAGTGNDYLSATGGNNYLDSGDGADILIASGDGNTLFAGAGDDTLSTTSSNNYMDGGDGNDTLVTVGEGNTLIGGIGNDTLIATGSGNTLLGGNGNDILVSNGGNNYLDGGAGADSMVGSIDEDNFIVDDIGDIVNENSGSSIDTVFSSVTYTLGANLENLNLFPLDADPAPTTLSIDGTGNELNNIISGNGGVNILTGKEGSDTYNVQNTDDTIVENFNEGIDQVNSTADYTLADNVENLTLSGTAAIDGTGNALNNVITGNTADNVLIGGVGDDTLYDSAGNDTYLFDLGDGQDILHDFAGTDTLRFGADINPSNITFTRSGLDMVLGIKDPLTGQTSDQLTLAGWGADITSRIEFIEFVDDATTVWNAAYLQAQIPTTITGTADDDLLVAWIGEHDTVIRGLAGNDYLAGGDGDDILEGGADSDTLYGLDGNNYFDGGMDDDIMVGGAGADTFVLELGAGQDRIDNADYADSIVFGADISPSSLFFSRETDSFLLSYGDAGDTVSMGFDSHPDELRFADGSRMTVDQLITAQGGYATAGSWQGEELIDTNSWATAFQAGQGDDIIMGGGSNTTYTFNQGDGKDSLIDLAGFDTIAFGAGITADNINFASENLDGVSPTFKIYYGSGDMISILNGEQGAIEQFSFDGDPTTYSFAELAALHSFTPVTPDVYMNNTSWLGFMDLRDKDLVVGTAISDIIRGNNDGNTAGFRANIYAAGKGDDFIEISEYNDGTGLVHLLFDEGDGHDWISLLNYSNFTNYDSEFNTALVFGGGIAPDSLTFSQSGADQIIAYGTQGDTILVEGGLDSSAYFVFADGSKITYTEMLAIQSGTASGVIDGTSTYQFNLGDGSQVVDAALLAVDTVSFGAGITPSMLSLGLGSLLIRVGDGGDELHIVNFNPDDVYAPNPIQNFQFTPSTGSGQAGSTLTYSQLIDLGFDLKGSAGDDVISGTNTTDRIDGYEGNDTLSGGAGSDVLSGGSGDDTYLFGYGDGVDRIYDYDLTADPHPNPLPQAGEGANGALGAAQTLYDTVQFAATVRPEDVAAVRNGEDLELRLANSSDKLILSNWYAGDAYQIEQVMFTDGTTWDAAYLLSQAPLLPIVGTEGDDTLYSLGGVDNHLQGLGGNDTLTGSGASDMLEGGAGDDTYVVDNANDVAIEYAEEGTDLVQSSVTFTLSDNIENLTLTGPSTGSVQATAINATGNALDNVLTGNGGDNVMNGVAGNDTLTGGVGADTYLFNLGDGQDTINDSPDSAGNTIRFGAGIAAADVRFFQQDADLLITYGAQGDSILIKDFAPDGLAGDQVISQFIFADGSGGAYTFDAWGNVSMNAYDGNGNLVSESWQGSNGYFANYTYDANGNLLSEFWQNSYGDYASYSYTYDANGNLLSATWQDSNGYGSDTYNADGSSSGTGYNPDGSYYAYTDDGLGLFNQLDFDANDNLITTYIQIDDGSGNSTGTTYDALGTILSDWWNHADGSYGNDTFNADGSSLGSIHNPDGTYSEYTDDGLGNVHTSAYDAGGNLLSDSWVHANEAPQAGVIADQAAIQDAAFNYQLPLDSFSDPDASDTLTYTATLSNGDPLPGWLTFDAATQTFSGTPGNADAGNLDLVVTATDTGGLSATADFNLTVADMITGTLYNDTINGTAGMDYVQALAGNDVVNAGDGNDIIIGGTGSDVLAGGLGEDTFQINGTDTSYDRFQGDAGYDVIQGSDGDDTVRVNYFTGASTVEKIDGGLGVNVIAGTQYNDTIDLSNTELANIASIDGGAGNDVITGSAGNDIIIGGAGSDVLAGGAGDDTFQISGTDTAYDRFQGDAGYDVIQGSDGDDTIRVNYFTGASTVEKIDGGLGVNVIAGTQYNDTIDLSNTELVNIANIDGGAGNDVITGSAGGDTIIGGAGSDVLAGGLGDDTFRINGTDTSYDRFQGDDGYDVIQGGDSDDTVRVNYFTGASTVEKIDGGLGINTVAGTQYNDTIDLSGTELANIAGIDGGAGNDVITGSAGNDTIIGGAGSDVLAGGAGDDIFQINGTDTSYDRFQGDAGYDVIQGGDGDDTIRMNYFTGASTVEKIDGGLGVNIIAGTQYNDTIDLSGTELANIASIDGGVGNDVITGSAGGDTIIGGAGSDVLAGSTGDDTFQINGTDTSYDRFQGDDGYDVIQGSDGDDTIRVNYYTGASTVEKIDGGLGINVIAGTQYNDTIDLSVTELVNIANIDGGAGNDVITGSAGNDLLFGGDGSDSLNGSIGNDVLHGGLANDKLTGTSGNNLFDGGAGTDTLTGNSGNELFIGGAGNDTITTGTGADIIAFNRGDGQDAVVASTGADNTISLGGGIDYQSLSMSKSGSNLILDTGPSTGSGQVHDQITLKNWYSDTANHSVANLQLVLDASAYNASSTDPLLNWQVQDFDFALLAQNFDQALAANPTLTSWNLTDSLLSAHLAGSDTAALGGDLAYQYNLNGALAGIGLASAQTVMNDAGFGVSPQQLHPLAELQTGTARLG